MDEKSILRNKLFERYFEVQDGIKLENLIQKISFIIEKWKELHNIIVQNIEGYDSYSEIEQIKIVEFNGNKYLIIKIVFAEYIIIDLNTSRCLDTDEIVSKFDEQFFMNNFKEQSFPLKNYYFYQSAKDLKELVDYYIENEEIFNMSHKIHHKLYIDKSYTYIFINLLNGKVQLCFETKDQFLYEQLFLDENLKPSRMQDAKSKIGVEKMNEMFERIKEIKIPESVIPDSILQMLNENKLIRKIN